MSDELAAYCLMLLAAACALYLLVQPRTAIPLELPGVVLPATAVQQQLRADAQAAARAPQDEVAQRLLRLIAAHGESEQRVVEAVDSYTQRRTDLVDAHRALVASHGHAGASALRAVTVERLEQALGMQLPADEVPGVMGAFAELLVHNNAVVRGHELAPHFVLRTLYKARFNLLCSRPPIDSFSSVERLAYFGWMGLQSQRLSAPEQLSALERYRDEGGANAQLALALLRLRAGQLDQAREALATLPDAAGSLRLQNFLHSVALVDEHAVPH